MRGVSPIPIWVCGAWGRPGLGGFQAAPCSTRLQPDIARCRNGGAFRGLEPSPTRAARVAIALRASNLTSDKAYVTMDRILIRLVRPHLSAGTSHGTFFFFFFFKKKKIGHDQMHSWVILPFFSPPPPPYLACRGRSARSKRPVPSEPTWGSDEPANPPGRKFN